MSSISRDPNVRSGVTTLRGTRFPVSMILGQLAEGQSAEEIVDDFSLDLDLVKGALSDLAWEAQQKMDRPLVKELADVWKQAYGELDGYGNDKPGAADAIVQAYATMKHTERLERLVRAQD